MDQVLYIKCHMSVLYVSAICHVSVSRVKCYVSSVIGQVLCDMCHISHVKCYVSYAYLPCFGAVVDQDPL